jgi:predicted RNA-binding protein associated with RNAse of E/G family
LDEDEFEDALKENWIDEKLAQKAKKSLEQIINIVKNDKFPPKFVKDYEEL